MTLGSPGVGKDKKRNAIKKFRGLNGIKEKHLEYKDNVFSVSYAHESVPLESYLPPFLFRLG